MTAIVRAGRNVWRTALTWLRKPAPDWSHEGW